MGEQMNKQCGAYDNYPAGVVLLSNAVSIMIYGLGAYIIGGVGVLFGLLYLLYCLWVESQVLKKSCVHCYYYGKTCAFGKGKISALLFKKGDPQRFIDRKVTWRDLAPDMLVLVIPLLTGIGLSIKEFSWLRVVLLAVLLLLTLGGNAFVRGSFACKYCRQRELGCPAEKLFDDKNKQKAGGA